MRTIAALRQYAVPRAFTGRTIPNAPAFVLWGLRACSLALFLLLSACGGGGGGGEPPTPTPPPPSIVLEGKALDPEHISLSWEATQVYTHQAYAITVNGSLYDVTESTGYYFHAQPSTRYCFKIVLGSWLPPFIPFYASSTVSNEVCITTPPLPPLASGWDIRSAGLGFGTTPVLAHYGITRLHGMYGCNGPTLYNSQSVFGYLSDYTSSPITFSVTGTTCGLAVDSSSLDAVTSDSSGIWYTSAGLSSGQWYSSTPQRVTADTGPFSVAMGRRILRETGGQVYLTQYSSSSGQWTSELVGSGHIGRRSLAVAPDGSIYALVSQAGELRVLVRGSTGWTSAFPVSGAPTSLGWGIGSIVVPANGDVRIAFTKPVNNGTAEGLGYLQLANGTWTESLVTTSTSIISAPAIAVGPTGETLISWGDENSDLRLSRGSIGNWQTFYIDALGDLARNTDIEVDVDGDVFILYSDANGPAKVAIGR